MFKCERGQLWLLLLMLCSRVEELADRERIELALKKAVLELESDERASYLAARRKELMTPPSSDKTEPTEA